MSQTKAAIFDLNGIMVQSQPLSERMQGDYGVPKEKFMPALAKIMDAVRKPGAAPMYSLWKPHLAKWRVPLSEKSFLNYWFSAEKENKEMTQYAQVLKDNGWKLFILSNNFKERVAYYRSSFSFFKYFDKAYFSCETGLVKPDEKCWTSIIQKNHLKPGNCHYFDDSEKNVDAARKAGLQAHVFKGLEETKKILDPG